MSQVSFAVDEVERHLIERVAVRASKLAAVIGGHTSRVGRQTLLDWEMDLTAAHANGCPLNLEKLLKADEGTFGHDVFGIWRHLDRSTGRLGGCFLPRCSKK